jgi:hypothetical protein
MFKKYSAIFLIVVLMLNFTIQTGLNLSPLEKSFLPDHSLRDVLISLRDDAENTNNLSPKSFKRIIVTLRKMIADLQDVHRQSKDIHEKMKKQCTEEISFRDSQVEDARTSISRSLDAKQLCDVSEKASRSDNSLVKDAIESYNFHLNRAKAQRDQENKLYSERKAELEEGLSFVKGFSKYLKKSFSSGETKPASFIDMSEELLRHASNAGALSETIPVLISISAMNAGDNSSDLSQKLLTTIMSLETRLKSNWEANEKSELSSSLTFVKYSAQVKLTIAKLNDSLVVVKEEISDMAKCGKEEDKINKWAMEKLVRNENLRKSSSEMCKKFDLQFVDATKNKLEEVTLIREILDIINIRFKNVPVDLQLYLEETEGKWKEYMNSSEFKQFVEYKHTTIEKSLHGKLVAHTDADKHSDPVASKIDVVTPPIVIAPAPQTKPLLIAPAPQTKPLLIAPAPQTHTDSIVIAPAPQTKPFLIAPAPQTTTAPIVIAPAPQTKPAARQAPNQFHLTDRHRIGDVKPKAFVEAQQVQTGTATLVQVNQKKFLH